MSDVADVYARLRSETAKLLGFDVAALSPAQDVRVSMVAGLRLEFDRLQTAQLRGEAIDPKALVAISEQLEAALRPAEVAERPGSSDAHRKLAELLEGRHRATLAEWARDSAREAEVAADFYRDMARPPQPARIGPPQPARVTHTYVDAGCLDDPSPPAPPPPRTLTPAEVARRIEAEMTAPRDEPWRPFVSENGIRTTSPFAPPGGPPRGW